MKKLFLLCLIFTNAYLFAQFGWDQSAYPGVPLTIGVDSPVWGTGVLPLDDDTATRRLNQGDMVLGGIAMSWGIVNEELSKIADIEYRNIRFGVLTSNLSPYTEGRLPESWLTTSGSQKRWVISYYLEVLHSLDRNTFLHHEQPWIDWQIEQEEAAFRWGHDSTDHLRGWYELVPGNLESLVFYNAIIIMGGFVQSNFFIQNIAPYRTGYKITMMGDFHFSISNDFWHSLFLPFPRFSDRQSFDMIFIPDGDYMDVYLDSIYNHFATFAQVDDIIMEELQRLIQANTVELSRITTWPRRADGSMNIPPPAGVTLAFRATHTTTARLNVRETPATTAPLVTTLELGTEVQILETGHTETIGEITAPWIRILSADGFTGWTFSGFLERIAVDVAVVENQPPLQAPAVIVPQADDIAGSGMPTLSAWVWLAVVVGVAAVGGVAFVVRRKRG